MKKRIIITNKQLNEFLDKKKSEKTFNEIIIKIYGNKKNLNENISLTNVNKNIIENYYRRGLLTPIVTEMLVKYNIINNDLKII